MMKPMLVVPPMAIAMSLFMLTMPLARVMADPMPPVVTVEQTQRALIVYETNLGQLIRKNLRFNTTAGATGNPNAVCLVKLGSEGEVESIKIVRSSGIYGFDTALQLAIYRSAPFSRREDGIMPKTITIHFWLR